MLTTGHCFIPGKVFVSDFSGHIFEHLIFLLLGSIAPLTISPESADDSAVIYSSMVKVTFQKTVSQKLVTSLII